MLSCALTCHAQRRSQQRSITATDIQIALDYGRLIRSYQDDLYLLDDRALRGTPYERQSDRLRGLSVVLTSGGSIRTVLWAHQVKRRGMLRRSRVHAIQLHKSNNGQGRKTRCQIRLEIA